MTVIALATTGLLACAFYIYVLWQWMRDGNGGGTNRLPFDGSSDGKQANKRPYIVASRKIAERRSLRRKVAQGFADDRLARRRAIGWNESERIAYRKIASSPSLRKRS
jgi:hypothetical protein